MSGILLDANVVSELMLPVPNANVERYVAGIERPLLSAAVFHELAYGVHLLTDGARKFRLAPDRRYPCAFFWLHSRYRR